MNQTQRELKFRSWDKANKLWYKFELLEFGSWESELVKHEKMNFEDWQQFTGFKDKKGKEVFEGDILSDNLNEFKFKIRWQGQGFECLFPNLFGAYINKRHFIDIQNMEVVGNIYENPDLIS